MKRKRMSDRKKQEVKESESRKTDKKVREDTKIGRIRWKEREREQEKT